MVLNDALRKVICSVHHLVACFLLDSLFVSAGNDEIARLLRQTGF